MSEATVIVTCQACGRELEEAPGLEQRPPCPHCGSTARLHKVDLTAEVKLRTSFAAKARRGARGSRSG